MALSVFLRFWQLTAVGFNSDEAVYTGSAASIAGNSHAGGDFPVFRAHPLLFQTLLSLVLRVHDTDWTARAFAAAIGVATVGLTFLLARKLYGTAAGLVAAALLAVMPYHVVVSRQVLLDGLMTLCATAALYCVARYVENGRLSWLLACAQHDERRDLVQGDERGPARRPVHVLRPHPGRAAAGQAALAGLAADRGRGGDLAGHAPPVRP